MDLWENEITDLKNILKNISLDQQQKMVLKGREIYEAYFTMKGMSYHILKTLQNYEGDQAHVGEVYANLVSVLEGRGTISTNGFEGLKTVEIIEKIYRAAGAFDA